MLKFILICVWLDKATRILLDSCLKLSTTLLEVYSPDGNKRGTSQTERQFKTDMEDFFTAAKCTGYDDDILVRFIHPIIANKYFNEYLFIQDEFNNRRTSPLIQATERHHGLSAPDFSFQSSHKLNKVVVEQEKISNW